MRGSFLDCGTASVFGMIVPDEGVVPAAGRRRRWPTVGIETDDRNPE